MGLSLAEQIAQLESTAPVEFDSEDPSAFGRVPEPDEEESQNARDHYVDVAPSVLRKAQDSISDPKYAGMKTSRKQLEEELSDEDESSDGQDEPELTTAPPAESDSASEYEPSDAERDAAPPITSGQPEDLVTLQRTRDQDREKGKAVANQLALWDNLLDARIRIQKSVAAANRLPIMDLDDAASHHEGYEEGLVSMLGEAVRLTDELFELQESLLRLNDKDTVTPPARKRRKLNDDNSPSELRQHLHDASKDHSALEHSYHPHLLTTLQKWSSKIQAVAPSVLLPSKSGAFSKGHQHPKGVVQLVDETLSERDKLLARTREYRGKAPMIGKHPRDGDEVVETENLDIFDDTDFYHQLLKDVLNSQGGGPGEDWMQVQKAKKAKKKVDTKASKGRKIRYDVHEKLQNFMPPMPHPLPSGGNAWHSEQIDELFSSLLGKGFEDALPEPAGAMEVVSIPGEFRVFGCIAEMSQLYPCAESVGVAYRFSPDNFV